MKKSSVDISGHSTRSVKRDFRIIIIAVVLDGLHGMERLAPFYKEKQVRNPGTSFKRDNTRALYG